MSIHTEKPNPRLSTKPVTTPENATSLLPRVASTAFTPDRRDPRRQALVYIVSFLVFLLLQGRNGRSPDGLERLARFPQFVTLRLDQVVGLLGVLVEGLLDLI